MGCPVLITSPFLEWSEELKRYLTSKNISSEIVSNGKECQLSVHREAKDFVVLDIETKANSSAEVLQYIKKSSPQTKIILVAASEEKLQELNLNQDGLKKLGAHCVLVKPFDNDHILEKIDPIRASVEKVSVTEDDFKKFVLLHNQLRILHQSKGTLAAKLKIISEIVAIHEGLLRDPSLREKTISFTKETSFLIAETMEKESNFSDFLKSNDLLTATRSYRLLFLSLMTAQNVEWSSRRTLESLVQGLLLRDIGKILENLSVEPIDEEKMSVEQVVEYKMHTWKAVIFLEEFESITEPVKQIVYQRHELVNARGFPLGISGNRIYPPVKILSLSEHFSEFILAKQLTPLEGLKVFMQDRASLEKFDPMVIKGFIKAFISKNKSSDVNGRA